MDVTEIRWRHANCLQGRNEKLQTKSGRKPDTASVELFETHFKLLYSRLQNQLEEDAYNLVADKNA